VGYNRLNTMSWSTKVIRSLLLSLVLSTLMASGMVARAEAATPTTQDAGFNLTASPLPIDLTTQPGKAVSTNLRIENSGTSPVKIKVSLLKFRASSTTGQPELLKRGPGDDYFDWVSFSKTSFTAQPGVWNDVGMTITPPKDAGFGYYYAVVFSQDSPKSTPTTVSGQLHGATATLVLLDVNAAGEKRQLSVESFTATKKVYEYLPASFNIKIKNTGNVHVIPTGDIFISRDHTHNLAVIPVNPNEGNTLPGSSRVFSADWSDGFPVYATKRDNGQIVSDKQGNPIINLKWDFSKTDKFRFGKYYAHLLLTYDDGTKDVPIDAEVAFWVIPWKLIFVAMLIPLIPALAVYFIMRRRVKKLRGKSTKYVAREHHQRDQQ